ncbi:hypothetical protein LTR36_000037 [Oleoguttula mirabilis]|uniref:SAM-dependent MTase RsmB/NOP-type domain-containing protein n=1 Tax=Oleoguttula mirabilis TaxID=1507867 RepID=A0AAV9JXF9_9PEZI|nr:hypothetical protein LTR36_000037 [Oleoguttula mirabilis]
MSLYHEAASVLVTARSKSISLKSIIYNKKDWKSDPKTLFALTTEAAKWSEVLSEVLEKSGVLKIERQLTPILALVLTHDLFLSKKGIALPASHGLTTSISKHKARLSAELTKARLRRGLATLEQLRASINEQASNGLAADGENGSESSRVRYPRWIRINTLKTTLEEQLGSTFAEYEQVPTLSKVTSSSSSGKRLHVDENIPNLIAVPASIDLTTSKAYKQGHLILQDKASCFPAYLLDAQQGGGDVFDACAAPGNKTTHLAAILQADSANTEAISEHGKSKVLACEKDATRSLTLQKMIKLAGGESVIHVKAKQDFMKLDPTAKEFAGVTALLLDPSCSGSGIVGRDEGGVIVHLPNAAAAPDAAQAKAGKKRKRGGSAAKPQSPPQALAVEEIVIEEEAPPTTTEDTEAKLQTRLANLSSFQLRLLERAMAFPAAKKITYSTCSVHPEENEHVVVKALQSPIATERGWRIMRRSEQVAGMRGWQTRGWADATKSAVDGNAAGRVGVEEVAEGCIRCEKGSADGTMGFFVAGLVRDVGEVRMDGHDANGASKAIHGAEEEEWGGFEDET